MNYKHIFIFSSDILSYIVKYLFIQDVVEICRVNNRIKYNIFNMHNPEIYTNRWACCNMIGIDSFYIHAQLRDKYNIINLSDESDDDFYSDYTSYPDDCSYCHDAGCGYCIYSY